MEKLKGTPEENGPGERFDSCVCFQDEHHHDCPALRKGTCHYQGLHTAHITFNNSGGMLPASASTCTRELEFSKDRKYGYEHVCGETGACNGYPRTPIRFDNKAMRSFRLVRTEDASGVSGIGIVAEGVEFSDGQCALHWHNFGSIGIYKDMETLLRVHGHEGRTKVKYI
jgi:hypothetical protein